MKTTHNTRRLLLLCCAVFAVVVMLGTLFALLVEPPGNGLSLAGRGLLAASIGAARLAAVTGGLLAALADALWTQPVEWLAQGLRLPAAGVENFGLQALLAAGMLGFALLVLRRRSPRMQKLLSGLAVAAMLLAALPQPTQAAPRTPAAAVERVEDQTIQAAAAAPVASLSSADTSALAAEPAPLRAARSLAETVQTATRNGGLSLIRPSRAAASSPAASPKRAAAALTAASTGSGFTENPALWDTSFFREGQVDALVVDGSGNIYVGVQMLTSGPASVHKWDGNTWTQLGPTLGRSSDGQGRVFAFVFDSSGNLFIGGLFEDAGGDPNADYLARWDGSNWVAVGGGLNSYVYALAFDSSGNLYVGGIFTDAGGNANADRIAKWDGNTWSHFHTGLSSTVYALAFDSSGSLYAGGSFLDASGYANADYIAKWNGSKWNALSSELLNSHVFSLAFDSSGTLYAGGNFSSIGSNTSTARIAKWNGSAWSALGSGLNYNFVYALTFDSNGALYAGGSFLDASGYANTARIAKWDGATWSALDTGLNSSVNALGLDSGGKLIVGGGFTAAGGDANANKIARWDGAAWSALSSQSLVPLGYGIGNNVNAFANGPAGEFYVGTYGAAYRWTGSGWEVMDGLNQYVDALAVDSQGTLYAGGRFTDVGGNTSADYLAYWDGSVWVGITGLSNSVKALAFDASDTLFVGGNFSNAGNISSADYLAKWKGGSWSTVVANLSSLVYALAFDPLSGYLYIGGSFSNAIPGVSRLLRWKDGVTSQVGSATLEYYVTALHVAANGDLYVAGDFENIGGDTSLGNIARWDGSQWHALGGPLYNRNDSAFKALLADLNGNLFLGGSFGSSSSNAIGPNADIKYLAVWDGNAWKAFGDANNAVNALITDAVGQIWVGGNFGILGGNPSSNIGLYAAPLVDLRVTPILPSHGETITYTIGIRNITQVSLSDIVLTHTLETVSAAQVSISGLTLTDSGAQPPYVWQVGDLAPGAGGVITITGQTSDGLHVPHASLRASSGGRSAVTSATTNLAASNGIYVNTLTDDSTPGNGLCSLREAIINANKDADLSGNDCNPGRAADTIYLASGTHLISADMPLVMGDTTIQGEGKTSTIISGQNLYRPFFIYAGTVEISDLSIINGYALGENGYSGSGGAAGMGGAIFVYDGDLTIRNVAFNNNQVKGGNGGSSYHNGVGGGMSGLNQVRLEKGPGLDGGTGTNGVRGTNGDGSSAPNFGASGGPTYGASGGAASATAGGSGGNGGNGGKGGSGTSGTSTGNGGHGGDAGAGGAAGLAGPSGDGGNGGNGGKGGDGGAGRSSSSPIGGGGEGGQGGAGADGAAGGWGGNGGYGGWGGAGGKGGGNGHPNYSTGDGGDGRAGGKGGDGGFAGDGGGGGGGGNAGDGGSTYIGASWTSCYAEAGTPGDGDRGGRGGFGGGGGKGGNGGNAGCGKLGLQGGAGGAGGNGGFGGGGGSGAQGGYGGDTENTATAGRGGTGGSGGSGGYGGGGGAGGQGGMPGKNVNNSSGTNGSGGSYGSGGPYGGRSGAGPSYGSTAGGCGGGGAGLGGAIFVRTGSLDLQTVSFAGNQALKGTVYNSTCASYGATDGQGVGGAVFVLNSTSSSYQGMPSSLATVRACGVSFASNTAQNSNNDYFGGFDPDYAQFCADYDGNLTSAAGVVEPVSLKTSAQSAGQAGAVFDFTLSDGGALDRFDLGVSRIVLHTSGTAPFGQVTWLLNGPGADNLLGVYDGGSNSLTFATSIAVADGGSQIYTVSGYYTDTSGLVEGQTFIVSVDGDTDLTVSWISGALGTQMGETSPVDNGTGAWVHFPPSIGSAPVTAATQDVAYTYAIAVDHMPGSGTVALGGVDLSDWLTLSDNGDGTGTLAGTPGNAEVGDHPILLQVTSAEDVTEQRFTLTVENVNDPPVFLSAAPTSVDEDAVYTYTVRLLDIDAGDVLTLTAQPLPGWLGFTDNGDGRGYLTGTPANGDVGEHPVQLHAYDGVITRTQSFTITVVNTNDLPVFVSSGPTAASEDSPYTYAFSATDDDGDALVFGLSTKPAWLSLLDNGDGTGTLSGTPANDDVGDNPVVLTASDGTGQGSQSFTIDVQNTNDAPIFSSSPELTATEKYTYTYAVSVQDVDVGDTLTLATDALPGWLGFADKGDGSGELSGIPSAADVGTANITLHASDGISTTDQSYTLTIKLDNQPPLFASQPLTGALRSEAYRYSVSVSDADNDPIRLVAVAKPAWLTLVDNGDGTGSLLGTPGSGDIGNFPVILRAGDGIDTATQTFTVSVDDVTGIPVFTSSPVTAAAQDSPYSYAVSAGDGVVRSAATLTITAILKPGWLSLRPSGDAAAELSGVPANGDVGSHRVVLKVFNGVGMFDLQTFDVTVQNVNDPPQIDSRGATTATQGVAYSYLLQATDPDAGERLTVSAPQKPAWLSLADNGNGTALLAGTPANGDVGQHSLELLVSDSGGMTVTQSILLAVADVNDSPVISTTPLISINEKQPYTYTVGATDPDSRDLLAWSAPIKPAWLNFFDNRDGTATLYGTPSPAHIGSHTVVLTVSDGNVTVSQAFTVAVADVNDLPLLETSPQRVVLQGNLYSYSIRATDEDANEVLLIRAVQKPAWLTLSLATPGVGLSTASLRGTPGIAQVGSHPVTLEVEDSRGGISSQTYTVTVPNGRPVLSDDLARAFFRAADGPDERITIRPLVNDFDPDKNPLTIVAVTQPASGGVSILAADQLQYIPAVEFVGRAVFTYTVSDGLDSVEAGVQVIVVPRNNAPRTRDDALRATTGFPVRIPALANDFDPDGHGMKITSAVKAVQTRSEVQPGVIAVNPDGASLTYLGLQAGNHNFVYTVQDFGGDYPLTSQGNVALEVRDYNPNDPIQYVLTGLGEVYTIRSGENQSIQRVITVTNLTDLATKASLRYELGSNVNVVDLTATTNYGVCRTTGRWLDCDFGIIPNSSAAGVHIKATVYAKVSGTLSEKATLTSVNPVIGGALPPRTASTVIEPRRESRSLKVQMFPLTVTADSFIPLEEGKLEINGSSRSPIQIGEHFRLTGQMILSPDGAFTANGVVSLLSEAEPNGISFLRGEFGGAAKASTILTTTTTSILAPLPFEQQNTRLDKLIWVSGRLEIKTELYLRFSREDEISLPILIHYNPLNAPRLFREGGVQELDFAQAGQMIQRFSSINLVSEGNAQYLAVSGNLTLSSLGNLAVPMELTVKPGEYAQLTGVGKAQQVSFTTSKGIVTLVEPRLEGNHFYAAGGSYLTSASGGTGGGKDIGFAFGPYGVDSSGGSGGGDFGSTFVPVADSKVFMYNEGTRELMITLPQNNKKIVKNFTLGEDAENDDFDLKVADQKMKVKGAKLVGQRLTFEAEIAMPDILDGGKIEIKEVWIGEKDECGRDLFSFDVAEDVFCVAELEQTKIRIAGVLRTSIQDITFEKSGQAYKISIYGMVNSIGVDAIKAESAIRFDLFENDMDFAFEGFSFRAVFLEVGAFSPFKFGGNKEFGVGKVTAMFEKGNSRQIGGDSVDYGLGIGLEAENVLWKDGKLVSLKGSLSGFDLIPGFPLKQVRASISGNPLDTYDVDLGATVSLGPPKAKASVKDAAERQLSADVYLRTQHPDEVSKLLLVTPYLSTGYFFIRSLRGAKVGYAFDYPLVAPNLIVLTGISGGFDLRSAFVGPDLNEEVNNVHVEVGATLAFGKVKLTDKVAFPIVTANPTLTVDVPYWIDKEKKKKNDWRVSLTSGAKLFDVVELGKAEITIGGMPFFADAKIEAFPITYYVIRLQKLTGQISFWVVDGQDGEDNEMFLYGSTDIIFVISPKVLASWLPNTPSAKISTGLEMGKFKYKNEKKTIIGMKGYAKVSIDVVVGSLNWSGKFFMDSDFDITTGGDVSNYNAVTRERVRRAWTRMAASSRQAVVAAPGLVSLPADMDLTFDQRSLTRLRTADLAADTLPAPQTVAVDVQVPYVTDVRVVLDSQVGGPSMSLTAPNGTAYGHDNLPTWITYTENVTYVPGPGLSPTAQAGQGQLRAVHAVNGGDSLDVLVNEQVVFSGLAYQQIGDYRPFAPGVYQIKFVPAGATTPVLAQASVTLAPGQDFTVLAVGTPGSEQAWTVADDNSPRGQDSVSFLRLVNTSQTAVTLQERMGGSVLANISAPGLGDYTAIFAKRTNLDVLNAATDHIEYALGKTTLEAGGLYTVFIFPDGEGVKALLHQDAAPVSRLHVTYAQGTLSTASLLVDGQVISNAFGLKQTAGPLFLSAGEHSVQLRNGGTPLLSETIVVSGQTSYGMALFEENGVMSSHLLVNAYRPDGEQAGLRLVHLAANAPPVDVVLLDPSTGLELPLLSGVDYQAVSDSRDVGGSVQGYTAIVRDSATQADLVVQPNVHLPAGALVTLYLRQLDGKLVLSYGTDAQLAAQTLSMYTLVPAQPGTWKVNLSGELLENSYELSVEGKYPRPTVTDVDIDSSGATPQVSWRLNSPIPNPNVSIYYQTEPIARMVTVTDTNGVPRQEEQLFFEGKTVETALTAELNPNWSEGSNEPYYDPAWTDGTLQHYSLPEGLLLSGTYYLYVEVDDGATDLIRVAAPQPLVIQHPWPASWNANLTAQSTDYREVELTWDGLANPDVRDYDILYTMSQFTETFSAGTSGEVGALLSNLDSGRTYTFTIQAQHRDEEHIVRSESVSVFVESADYGLAYTGEPLQVIAGQSVSGQMRLTTAFQPHPVSVALFAGERSPGVGLEFDENQTVPTSAGATLPFTITTSSYLSSGVYTATVLAIGGGVDKNIELPIQILAPSFELAASQDVPTLTENGEVVVSITADRLLGHDVPIWLELENSPSLANAFDDQWLGVGETRLLTITDLAFIDGGVYTYTITGSDGVNEVRLERSLEVAKSFFRVTVATPEIHLLARTTNTLSIPLQVEMGYGWTAPVTLLLDREVTPPRSQFGFPVAEGRQRTNSVGLEDHLVVNQSQTIELSLETLPRTPAGLYRLTIQAISDGQQQDVEMWLTLTGPPDLSVSNRVALAGEDASDSIIAAPGESVVYVVAVDNLGDMDASEVTLNLPAPAQLTNLNYTSSGVTVLETNGAAWQLADLTPGQSGLITITGTLDPNLTVAAAAPFTSTASIAAALDGDWANNSADAGVVVNFVPVAGDDNYRVLRETSLQVESTDGLLANDSDPNGDALSVTLLSQPSAGQVSLAADGSFIYTAPVGFNSGYVTFDYSASDGSRAGRATATIRIFTDLPGIALSPGWNLFGWPLQDSQPISQALQTIDGGYEQVLHWNSQGGANPWRIYNPAWNELLNDLWQMDFGQGYWIRASRAVTVELESADVPLEQQAAAAGIPLPPATFYGVVNAADGFTPAAGMAVQAWMGEALCGEGTTVYLPAATGDLSAGSVVYKIHVQAEGVNDQACGASGRLVRLKLAGTALEAAVLWSREQVWRVDLGQAALRYLYLPITSGVTPAPSPSESGDEIADEAKQEERIFLPSVAR